MTEAGRTVSGRLGSRVLARAAALFDQSIRSITAELVQNARRAGATRLECWIEQGGSGATAVFQDDGRGVDDPATLVELGGSGWEDGSSPAEDRAGMGLFSLAMRGCAVTSMGRSYELGPAVFAGAETAQPRTVPFRAGTTVRFPLRPGEAASFDATVKAAGIHAPLPIVLEGTPVPRLAFLASADAVEEHEGVMIGIYGRIAWTRRWKALRAAGMDEGWRFREMNFGGHLVEAPEHDSVGGSWGGWKALWDVGEGSALRMVLPARDAVIEDAAWAGLLERTLLLQCRATQPRKLAMGWVTYAHKRGLRLRVPEMELVDLVKHHEQVMEVGEAYDNAMRRTAGAVIVPADWGKGATHAVVAAARRHRGRRPGLACETSRLEGLERYDELPRLCSIRLAVTWPDGKTQVMADMQRASDHHADDRPFGTFMRMTERAASRGAQGAPTRLEVTLVHRDAAGNEGSIGPVEVPFVFVNGDSDMSTEARRLASSGCAPDGLMELVREEGAANYDPGEHQDMADDGGPRYTRGNHQASAWWDLAAMAMPREEYAVHLARTDGLRIAERIRDAGLGDLVSTVTVERAPKAGTATVTVVMTDGKTASRDVRTRQPRQGRKP